VLEKGKRSDDLRKATDSTESFDARRSDACEDQRRRPRCGKTASGGQNDRVDDAKGRDEGTRDGLDLIRGDSDRGDIPESDTQSGELVCGASAARPVQRMNIVESFF